MRAAALAAVVVASAAATAPAQEPTVQSGFGTDVYAGELERPVGLAFLPDGSTLVTDRTGVLNLIDRTTQKVTQAYDLGSQNVCSGVEQGLLGVAVDPNFNGTTREGYVYLFYTKKNVSDCLVGDFSYGSAATSPATNRVSRFQWQGNGIVDGTEQVLLENIPNLGGTHNGGDIAVGKDGKLYVSIGDGGCDPIASGGLSSCSDNNLAASRPNVLAGKILRINTDGTVPADNPFASTGQSCALVGIGADPNSKCKETWVSGLRNPFRFALDPNTAAGAVRLFWNDVGSNTWEEVNEGFSGDDYGWPAREGFCLRGQSCTDSTPGKPSGANYRNPLHVYRTTAGGQSCKSIAGGTFPVDGEFGGLPNGTYLFNDYGCGKVWRATRGTNGQLTGVSELGNNFFGAITMKYNPVTKSVFLIQYFTDRKGQLREIFPNAGTNLPPKARMEVRPDSGSLPLTVELDARESSDPENGTTGLTYVWDLGNGQTQTTTNALSSYTYPANSGAVNRTITLTVKDQQGKESRFKPTFTVYPGNTAPQVTITTPVDDNALFSVGETLQLSGSATDAEDGALSGASLKWTIVRFHNDHTHPYGSAVGATTTITGPLPEGLEGVQGSYVIVELTATDSRGLSRTVTRKILPRKRDLTVQAVNPNNTPNANVSPDVHVNRTQIKTGDGLDDEVCRNGVCPVYDWVTTTLWEGWQGVEVRPSSRAVDRSSTYGVRKFGGWADDSAAPRRRLINVGNANRTLKAKYYPVPESEVGLSTEYFNNTNFTSSVRKSWQERSARKWSSGTPSGVGAGTWSARYKGSMVVDEPGTYEFTVEADEFIRVKVGGQTLIDKFTPGAPIGLWVCDLPDQHLLSWVPFNIITVVPWINGPAPFAGFPWFTECTGEWFEVLEGGPIKRDRKSITLTEGETPIEIEYANNAGAAYWDLKVAGPGMTKRNLERHQLVRR